MRQLVLTLSNEVTENECKAKMKWRIIIKYM